MIEIKQISSYIMDSGERLLIGGERKQVLGEEERRFLFTKLEKLFSANRRKEGTLAVNAWISEQLRLFQQGEQSFEELSACIAQRYYDCKRECNRFAPSALVIALAAYEEAHHLVLLDQSYRSGYHCILDDRQQAVYAPTRFLSQTLLKDDFGFTLSLGDHTLHVLEQRSDRGYVLSEHFLQVQPSPSYDEIHRVMEENVRGLSEKYEMDTTQALTRMKQVTKYHVEEQEELSVSDLAEEIFAEVPYAADEFCMRMKQEGIREMLPLEQVKVRRSLAMQRIKTDTGVELAFPVEYMEEGDKLAITHERDGMIEIAVKNVSHIQNR